MIPPVIKKKKREHPLESKVESYFKKQVGIQLGASTWKFSSPQKRGVSDQILVCDSIVMFVEIKAVKGKISPKQETFYRDITKQFAVCTFVFGHSGVDNFILAFKTLQLAIQSAENIGCSPPISSYMNVIKKEYH